MDTIELTTTDRLHSTRLHNAESIPATGITGLAVLVRLTASPAISRADVARYRHMVASQDALPVLMAGPNTTLSEGAVEELAAWKRPLLIVTPDSAGSSPVVGALVQAGLCVVTGIDAEAAGHVRPDDMLLILPVGAAEGGGVPCRVLALRNPNLPWFDVEEIATGVYSLAEPGHREYVRSYLVLGEREAALIDTGAGIGDIRAEVDRLTTLPVRVILTHTHWDHIGGAYQFENVAVFDEPVELARLQAGFPLGSKQREALARDQIRPKKFGRPWPPYFQPEQFAIPGVTPRQLLHDGDVIDLGGRSLRVLHTPGHSPGSISLLDPDNRLLYVGDFFYWGPLFGKPGEFSLDAYRRTAARLVGMADQVDRVFPGHNELELNGRAMGPDDLMALARALDAIERGDAAVQMLHTYDFADDFFSVES